MALLTLLILVAGLVYYVSVARKNATDTPNLRRYFGCEPGETLAGWWSEGLHWLRPGDEATPELVPTVASVFDTFALALTTDGVFILNDNKRRRNVGVVRFRRSDIGHITRLDKGKVLVAPKSGKKEPLADVTLRLTDGPTYWLRLPESALTCLLQPDPTRQP